MADNTGIWSHWHEHAWTPYDLEVSKQIEETFSAFWRSGVAIPTFEFNARLCGEDELLNCVIDFRVLEQSSITADGSGRRRCAVRRQDPHLATQTTFGGSGSAACNGGMQVEWGHAQDPVCNVGIFPYAGAVSALLESAHAVHSTGRGLKGIVITGPRDCDYMVDFVRMQQTRIVTRRVRHIYRHFVSAGARMGSTSGTEEAALRLNAATEEWPLKPLPRESSFVSTDTGGSSSVSSEAAEVANGRDSRTVTRVAALGCRVRVSRPGIQTMVTLV